MGDKRKDVREVNRAVKDYLDSEYVEDLINKLAAERYNGFTERSPVVKDFKTRMRNLFKLPSMKKIVPKLVSQHIQEKANRKKIHQTQKQLSKTFRIPVPLLKPISKIKPILPLRMKKPLKLKTPKVKTPLQKGEKPRVKPTSQRPRRVSSIVPSFSFGPPKYIQNKNPATNQPSAIPTQEPTYGFVTYIHIIDN